MLDLENLLDSFSAVKSFLQAGGFNSMHGLECECGVNIMSTRKSFNDIFEFEVLDNVPTYKLHSNTFKANGYYMPVWSAYHSFAFDENTGSLSVTLNGKIYNLKHKK